MSDYFANATIQHPVPTMELATKTPEVEILLHEIEKEVEQLFDSLKGLEARLDPLMVPSSPQNIKGVDAVPSAPHSQLFSKLEGIRLRLVADNIMISNIKGRLEV